MFQRFTEKAMKVTLLSDEESRRLGHNSDIIILVRNISFWV